MIPRFLRHQWLVILFCLSAIIAGGWLLFELQMNWQIRSKIVAARDKSIQLLSRARSVEELRETVGDIGMVCTLPDGHWIAIRYVDTHTMPMWSSAVALDSEGRWYASDVHFCGRFKIYQDLKATWKSLTPSERRQFNPSDGELSKMDNAADLVSARLMLEGLGFHSIDANAKPALGKLNARPGE